LTVERLKAKGKNMDDKGNIYRIDEDGYKELFEVIAKAEQDEKQDLEEPVVILVNRHERRKRAKLARLEEKKAIAERRKAKG
jgi:hypothetical protein